LPHDVDSLVAYFASAVADSYDFAPARCMVANEFHGAASRTPRQSDVDVHRLVECGVRRRGGIGWMGVHGGYILSICSWCSFIYLYCRGLKAENSGVVILISPRRVAFCRKESVSIIPAVPSAVSCGKSPHSTLDRGGRLMLAAPICGQSFGPCPPPVGTVASALPAIVGVVFTRLAGGSFGWWNIVQCVHGFTYLAWVSWIVFWCGSSGSSGSKFNPLAGACACARARV
jgi:hypothetical protein